jgi:hypothetical protein
MATLMRKNANHAGDYELACAPLNISRYRIVVAARNPPWTAAIATIADYTILSLPFMAQKSESTGISSTDL